MTTPAPPMPATRKKPFWGFIIAPAVFVITAVIGIVMIAMSIGTLADLIQDMHSVQTGSTAELTLKSGEYYVFAVAPMADPRDAVRATIVGPDGAAIVLDVASTNYSGDSDGDRFRTLGTFDVTTAGTYRVTAEGSAGGRLAIGKVPIGRFVALLVGGIVVGGIGFVVAAVILIIAIVRRVRASRRERAAIVATTPPMAPPPPASGTLPPPPPPPPAS